MSELYTSLTQLKMAMNGGTLPPMTPLTERAAKLLDPAFTIGMGALMEDPEKGLRCPVRGCGSWKHSLVQHANRAHKGIGGAQAIRSALGIPRSAALVSKSLREALRRAAATTLSKGARFNPNRGRQFGAADGPTTRYTGYHATLRNLRGICEVQLSHKLIDLQNKIGRQPTAAEFRVAYGSGAEGGVRSIYGSWSNALSHFGYSTTGRISGIKRDSVALLDGLHEWYKAHGDLPRVQATKSPTAVPLLHHQKTYLRAFKTDSWPEAMRRAAAMLNIYGGKYGLPESARPKEDVA